jgi:hypothetical protein
MGDSFKQAVWQAAAEIAPKFGQTMTFSVALQIVQPLRSGGVGTLIVLSLAVAVAVVVIAMTRVYVTTQGWSSPPAGASEIRAIAGPAVDMVVHLLHTAELVMVQFQSVLVGSILVQEATRIQELETTWAVTYAAFGVALGWAMSRSLGVG